LQIIEEPVKGERKNYISFLWEEKKIKKNEKQRGMMGCLNWQKSVGGKNE